MVVNTDLASSTTFLLLFISSLVLDRSSHMTMVMMTMIVMME